MNKFIYSLNIPSLCLKNCLCLTQKELSPLTWPKKPIANYINAGSLILEASAHFELSDEIIGRVKKDSGISITGRRLVPNAVLQDIEKTFRAGLSWVPSASGISEDKRIMATTAKIGITYLEKYIHVPLVINVCGGFDVMFHECIHAIRHFTNSHNNAFEEAFAFYRIESPSHYMFDGGILASEKYVINEAKRMLEDAIGNHAHYALVRLSRQDTYNLFFSNKPLDYLKGLNLLRHKIVKEKLGI